jgi:hypothetical protein
MCNYGTGQEPEPRSGVVIFMEYGIGIAGLSDLIGLAVVILSILVVGFYLQSLKGPSDRHRLQ